MSVDNSVDNFVEWLVLIYLSIYIYLYRSYIYIKPIAYMGRRYILGDLYKSKHI